MPRKTMRVDVENVREGDYLPGVGDAYVFEAPDDEPNVSFGQGHGVYAAAGNFVMVTFHTNDGEEGYLMMPPGSPVTVEREES